MIFNGGFFGTEHLEEEAYWMQFIPKVFEEFIDEKFQREHIEPGSIEFIKKAILGAKVYQSRRRKEIGKDITPITIESVTRKH